MGMPVLSRRSDARRHRERSRMRDQTQLPMMAREHVREDPHGLYARITVPDWKESWLKAFKRRLDDGKRDAVRMYAEILGLLGEKSQLVFVLLQQWGVNSPGEAEQLITM